MLRRADQGAGWLLSGRSRDWSCAGGCCSKSGSGGRRGRLHLGPCTVNVRPGCAGCRDKRSCVSRESAATELGCPQAIDSRPLYHIRAVVSSSQDHNCANMYCLVISAVVARRMTSVTQGANTTRHIAVDSYTSQAGRCTSLKFGDS